MPRVLFLNVWIGSLTLTGAARQNNVGIPALSGLQDYISANCDFEHGACGWANGNDKHAAVMWTMGKYLGNCYTVADMKDTNGSGLLTSPGFTPTLNRRSTLSFRYFMEYDRRCQLTVYMATATGKRQEIWNTTKGTGQTFTEVSPIPLPFTNEPHQIMFEGRKLSYQPCGGFIISIPPRRFDEINLDDIRFHSVDIWYPTTSTTTPSSSRTTLQPADSNDTTVTPGPVQLKLGLRIGETAGIVVAAMVAIVVAVVLVFVIRRKRSAHEEQHFLTSTNVQATSAGNGGIVNHVYVIETESMQSHGTSGTNGGVRRDDLLAADNYNKLSFHNPRFPNQAARASRPYDRLMSQ